MLQIILEDGFAPDNPEYKGIVSLAELPFHDNNFNKTMELIKAGDINKLYVFPISNANRLKEEFLNNILEDGYPCSDKLNIMLTSKSGIKYFVVDGRCFPDEETKKDSLRTKINNEEA